MAPSRRCGRAPGLCLLSPRPVPSRPLPSAPLYPLPFILYPAPFTPARLPRQWFLYYAAQNLGYPPSTCYGAAMGEVCLGPVNGPYRGLGKAGSLRSSLASAALHCVRRAGAARRVLTALTEHAGTLPRLRPRDWRGGGRFVGQTVVGGCGFAELCCARPTGARAPKGARSVPQSAYHVATYPCSEHCD